MRLHRLLAIAVILLAFALRLRALDWRALWYDEAMEFWVASSTLGELPDAVLTALQDPPLYSFLLHFWQGVGIDEFTLRLPSTFASLLSVAGMLALGRALDGRAAGLVGALILAVSPPDIRFAQEVGQYAFLVCLLVLNLLILRRALATDRGWHWVGWLATGLASVYTHYGALLAVVPVAGIALVWRLVKGGRRSARAPALALAGFVVLSLPLAMVWIPAQLFRGSSSEAFRPSLGSLVSEFAWLLERTKAMLTFQLAGFLGNATGWERLRLAGWLLMILGLVAALAGHRKRSPLLLWLAGAWLAYLVVGRLGAYPYNGTRHALILTPLLVAAVAVGAAALWRAFRPAGLALLLAILVVAWVAPPERPEDLRSLVAQWQAQPDAEAPTYVYYGAVPGFRYQLQLRQAVEPHLPGLWYFRCWSGEGGELCANEGVTYGSWIRALPPEEKVDHIREALGAAAGRFWLVLSHTDEAERAALVEALLTRYELVDALQAEGAAAYLLEE